MAGSGRRFVSRTITGQQEPAGPAPAAPHRFLVLFSGFHSLLVVTARASGREAGARICELKTRRLSVTRFVLSVPRFPHCEWRLLRGNTPMRGQHSRGCCPREGWRSELPWVVRCPALPVATWGPGQTGSHRPLSPADLILLPKPFGGCWLTAPRDLGSGPSSAAS